MRNNYVLIDFESVQPESLEALDLEHFKLFVFVGASQTKLPFGVVSAMQRFGERAEYVKISGNGPNALDFHIAYYIGKLAYSDASAFFHIISKDTGFDPLIQHLKSGGVFAGRVKSIDEIPMVKVSNAKSPTDRCRVAADWLAQTKASKPRTVKTLSSTIASLFQKQLSDAEVAQVIEALTTNGHVFVSGTKVTYAMQASG
jgi:PIN domain